MQIVQPAQNHLMKIIQSTS